MPVGRLVRRGALLLLQVRLSRLHLNRPRVHAEDVRTFAFLCEWVINPLD